MPWFHLCRARPCTQLDHKAKLGSTAFEAHGAEGIPLRMPLPPLLAAEAHPPCTKAADGSLVEGTH